MVLMRRKFQRKAIHSGYTTILVHCRVGFKAPSVRAPEEGHCRVRLRASSELVPKGTAPSVAPSCSYCAEFQCWSIEKPLCRFSLETPLLLPSRRRTREFRLIHRSSTAAHEGRRERPARPMFPNQDTAKHLAQDKNYLAKTLQCIR